MLQSGIHTTIAGVLFAFALPYADGKPQSPSTRLEHLLNRPVAWLVMPLFAFSNGMISLTPTLLGNLLNPNTLGIAIGMLVGKPIGIFSSVWIATKAKWGKLPAGLTYAHMLGLGIIGGIGFTMSIFITNLAFGNAAMAAESKIMIMLCSLAAGLLGYGVLTLASTMNVHPTSSSASLAK